MSRITFFYPHKTRIISLTGTVCDLACAHCGGYYLRHMKTPGEVLRRGTDGVLSALISGGCDRQGRIPVTEHLPFLRELRRRGLRLNFHLGLADRECADLVAPLAEVVSFDFVFHEDTIREVYGFSANPGDFLRVYLMLRERTKVIPHLVIGLRGGRICGEFEALNALRCAGADCLVLLVMTPTPGTAFHDRPPPCLEEVRRVFLHAREIFPEIPIYLGCMRPGGAYRRWLDVVALVSGLDGIVMPARSAIRLADEEGLKSTRKWECCVL